MKRRKVEQIDDDSDLKDFQVTYTSALPEPIDSIKFQRTGRDISLFFTQAEMNQPESGNLVRVFTDGSARQNGSKRAKGGIGVYFPDGQCPSVSLPYRGHHLVVCPSTGQLVREEQGSGVTTNQRAELEAIRVAIDLACTAPNYEKKRTEIKVYTDSQYSIQCLTVWIYTWVANNWKTARDKGVKNRDIIEPLFATVLDNRVSFYHTEAHTEKQDERSRGNSVANSLAQKASAPIKKL